MLGVPDLIRILSDLFVGHVVAQMAEALRYKPGRCGFDFHWCHWNFFIDYGAVIVL